MEKKKRNVNADMLRGLAILLVILGHTITGVIDDYEGSALYNLIWCLQMPLFMLISGYVACYGRTVHTGRDLAKTLLHKTIVYLQPWLVWTVGVRGLLIGESDFLKLDHMLWHMDSGYWFLFSIWMIVCCFTVARYAGEQLKKAAKHGPEWLYVGIPYVALMAGLDLLGKVCGLSFLCIKLTLYYMPFFFLGYLYGSEKPRIQAWKKGKAMQQWVIALSCIVFVALILRFDFWRIEDNLQGILLRAAVSLAGCVAFCGLVTGREPKGQFGEAIRLGLAYIGQRSLQLYVLHYLFLSMLRTEMPLKLMSFEGIGVAVINWVLTTAVCMLVIHLLEQNEPLQRVLFAKRKNVGG